MIENTTYALFSFELVLIFAFLFLLIFFLKFFLKKRVSERTEISNEINRVIETIKKIKPLNELRDRYKTQESKKLLKKDRVKLRKEREKLQGLLETIEEEYREKIISKNTYKELKESCNKEISKIERVIEKL